MAAATTKPLEHAVSDEALEFGKEGFNRASKVIDDFTTFIARGNVIDLAVAVVIGGAFTAVVNSLVNDIITPVVSLIVKKNLENWFYVIRKGRTPGATYSTIAEASADGAVTENLGRFLQTIFNFVIIGWIVFIIVKATQKLRSQPWKIPPPPADPTTRECQYCTSTIQKRATRCPFCTSEVGANK